MISFSLKLDNFLLDFFGLLSYSCVLFIIFTIYVYFIYLFILFIILCIILDEEILDSQSGHQLCT